MWHGLVDREQKLVCASTLGSFRSMVRFDGTREEDLGTNPLPFRKLNLLGSGFQNPEWGSSWIEHLNKGWVTWSKHAVGKRSMAGSIPVLS